MPLNQLLFDLDITRLKLLNPCHPWLTSSNGSSRSRCAVGARVKIAISRGGCYHPSASTKQKMYPYSPLIPYIRGCAARNHIPICICETGCRCCLLWLCSGEHHHHSRTNEWLYHDDLCSHRSSFDERIHLLDRVGGTGTMGLDQPRERGRSMLPSRAWL